MIKIQVCANASTALPFNYSNEFFDMIDLTIGERTGGSLNLVGVEEVVLGAMGDTVHYTSGDVLADITPIDDGAGADEWLMVV